MINPKVKIICITKTSSKLALVKLVKEFAEIGLKDSKDIVDRLENYNDTVEFEYEGKINNLTERLSSFRRELDYLPNAKYIVTCLGVEMEREQKLLSLGLGQRDECVAFLSDYMKMFRNFDDVLKLTFSYLTDEELADVISKLEK
jgi:hypothetical protein